MGLAHCRSAHAGVLYPSSLVSQKSSCSGLEYGGAGPKLAMARSVWMRQKGTDVTGRRGSWSWQFLRRGCQFPLQFKESLHLSASECGMGSWPKRCGWEPGPRRRGRTRVHLHRAWNENLSTRQERRGVGGTCVPITPTSPGNQESIALTSWTSYQVS